MKIENLTYIMSSDADLNQMIEDLHEIINASGKMLSRHAGTIFTNNLLELDKDYIRKFEYVCCFFFVVKNNKMCGEECELSKVPLKKDYFLKQIDLLDKHFSNKTADEIRYFQANRLVDYANELTVYVSSISEKTFQSLDQLQW